MAKPASSKLMIITFLFLFSFPQSIFPFENPKLKSELKLNRFQLYLHEIELGVNQSTVHVTEKFNHSPTDFGILSVMDCKITERPDFNSKEVGRVQGMFSLTSQTYFSLFMAYTLVFTDGKYKESTLVVLGRNNFRNQVVREMPIVGGTGKFRFARGYVLTKTVSFNPTLMIGVYEYDFYVSY